MLVLCFQDMSCVRSLLVFDNCVHIDTLSASFTSLKLLSVLDLEGTPVRIIPVQVFRLFNLRYLGLRGTEIDALPKEIKKLQNLEVLDAYNTRIAALPEEMTKLRKLRHLFASGIQDRTASNVVVSTGVTAPQGKWHSTSVQTLQNFEANDEMLQNIACLSELRTLGVTDVRSGQSARLCSAISKLCNLRHLLVSSKGDEVLQLPSVELPQTIQKLEVGGPLEKATARDPLHIHSMP